MTTLQQAGAEEGADEDNSTANEGTLAHVANKERVGSGAGRSSRSGASVGSGVGGVGGNSGHTAGTGLSSGSRLATSVLAAGTLETGALAGAVLHVLIGSIGKSRELVAGEVLDVPGVAVRGAGAGAAVGLVAAVTRGSGVVGELLHEVLEVVVLGVGVARDRAKTVLGFFLRVLVDETARVDRGHVRIVERLDGAESAGVLVAAVLGKAGIESV